MSTARHVRVNMYAALRWALGFDSLSTRLDVANVMAAERKNGQLPNYSAHRAAIGGGGAVGGTMPPPSYRSGRRVDANRPTKLELMPIGVTQSELSVNAVDPPILVPLIPVVPCTELSQLAHNMRPHSQSGWGNAVRAIWSLRLLHLVGRVHAPSQPPADQQRLVYLTLQLRSPGFF